MRLIRLPLTLLLSLLLSACFQVQLTGSVGGATLSISILGSDEVIYTAPAPTMVEDDWRGIYGAEAWDSLPSLVRLVFIGISTTVPDNLDPDALYLVSVTGGQDYDPDVELEVSDSPQSVQGTWHAIISGSRIIAGNVKVSAITEALYQQYLALPPRQGRPWTNAELLTRLDAGARLLVGDVDGNGTVDYDDALRWNRSIDAEHYSGDITDVDKLSEAIRAGQPSSQLSSLAAAVFGNHEVTATLPEGSIVLRTHNWESPITAANFLTYVVSGFYDDVFFHRVAAGFVIQGGLASFLGRNEENDVEFEFRVPNELIINEAGNGLKNDRATVAMARTGEPDSAGGQYFVNLVDNDFLNYGSSSNPDGYAVFATVIEGMDLVDSIATTPTFVCTTFGFARETPQTASAFGELTLNRSYQHTVTFDTQVRTGC
jgi:peptidyl-prolyl cis-trans isomerase A (cyclophilin A)